MKTNKTEEELLQDIFGVTDLFQGLRVQWCDLCETWALICPDCQDGAGGGSCSSVCPKCEPIQKAFTALKPSPWRHLSPEDYEAVQRYWSIKRLLLECIKEGVPLDIKERNARGMLSENEQRLFKM